MVSLAGFCYHTAISLSIWRCRRLLDMAIGTGFISQGLQTCVQPLKALSHYVLKASLPDDDDDDVH